MRRDPHVAGLGRAGNCGRKIEWNFKESLENSPTIGCAKQPRFQQLLPIYLATSAEQQVANAGARSRAPARDSKISADGAGKDHSSC